MSKSIFFIVLSILMYVNVCKSEIWYDLNVIKLTKINNEISFALSNKIKIFHFKQIQSSCYKGTKFKNNVILL